MSFFGDDAFEDDAAQGEGEDEEEEEDKKNVPQRDMIIMAVDGSDAMYATNDKGESPIQRALAAISFFYKDHIIISEQDFLSVVLYNTNPKDVGEDFLRTDTVMTLLPPNRPSASEVQKLKKLSEDVGELKSLTGGTANSSLEAVLQSLHVMQTVDGRHLEFTNKSIYVFTNNDNPQCDKRRLKALQETWRGAASIVGFFMPRTFDVNKFWNGLINALNPKGEDDTDAQIVVNVDQSWEDLSNRVRRKIHKKRILMKLGLEIAPGVEIGVSMYNLVAEARPAPHAWVTAGDQPKDVKTEMRYVGSVGDELADFQLASMMEFGSEAVIFETQEVKKLKDFGQPGIKLLGFKPRSALKIHHNIRNASFIYPNNETVEGSITAFAALHTKMLDLDKIAICKIVSRFSKYPRLVALLPQAAVLDEETGAQKHPPGFHVIYLPFADDIRKLEIPEAPKATAEQVSKAKQVIKAMALTNFDCHDFDNPNLQRHYDVLQAQALMEGTRSDDGFDVVMPPRGVGEKSKRVVEEWAKEAWGDDFAEAGEPSGKKAKAVDPEKAAAAAEKKKAAAAMADSFDWKELAGNGELKSLTMDQLKSYCRTNGLKLTGKKEELVARVEAHVTSK